MIEEIWKNIPGYEGMYLVSNFGNVKSVNYEHTGKEKLLRLGKLRSGYLRVLLCKNGNVKYCLVHRLVWLAFNGEIPERLQINHKDENKTNNSLENLELMTPKENSNYGTRNQRLSKPVIGRNKITGEETEYPSLSEAFKQTGIALQNICQCCKGKYKSAGGYTWRYKNNDSLQ